MGPKRVVSVPDSAWWEITSVTLCREVKMSEVGSLGFNLTCVP